MHIASTFSLLCAALLFLQAPAVVQAQTTSSAGSAGTFVYKPPLRGAPARRVGGATRGTGDSGLVLQVLAPDQTGLTTQAQPTLYWYASKASNTSIEVTLIADSAEVPVLSKNLALTAAGVQSVDLEKLGVTLQPETDYEWYVSAVSDTDQRSKDVTSGGAIRRVAADPVIRARAEAAGATAAPGVYAEAGLWYDAIAALSRLIERNPADARLRAQRAALLEQVGLPKAAEFDRAGGS
ncbi:DUF928 domain-containing protein [Comamonadaceae bacterium G21597-S1]|nr:DUF928 domain-containing protein [Comamonadaceae bacterium G21597-S1]